MPSARPPTPDPVARQLRQEAGFGCCRCGFPVVQYHHIVPWHVEEHFRPEDMMALCPNCHGAVTEGAFIEEQQRRIKGDPFNVRQGYASGALLLKQPFAAIRCGGTFLVGDGPAIMVDGDELLRLAVTEDRELELSVNLQDEHGESLALIDRNEWISGDPSLWDLVAKHRRLQLWNAPRDIRLHIDARGVPVDMRADLWHNGHRVRLNAQGISWGSSGASFGSVQNIGLVGASINLRTQERDATFSAYRGRAMFVGNEADPMDRLTASLQAWAEVSGSGSATAMTIKREA